MVQLRLRDLAAALALSSAVPALAASQSTTVLTGVVMDQMQGLVEDATVVLIDAKGVEQRKTRTDSHRYTLKAAPDGDYRVEVRRPGFTVATDVVALSGGTMERDATLKLGSLTETVTVRTSDPSGPKLLATGGPPPPRPCTRAFTIGGQGGYLDAPLKTLNVFPRYPASLKKDKTEGKAVIHAVVNTEGAVTGMRVLASTHPEFASAATEAIALWRYQATRLNCSPLDTVMRVDVVFER